MPQKPDTKQVRKYWRTVGKRAWESASGDAGVKIAFITLVLLLFVVGLAGLGAAVGVLPLPFLQNQTDSAQAGALVFCGSLPLLMVLFFLALYRAPAEMDKEKADQIDTYKKKVKALEGDSASKLELSYGGDVPPFYHIFSDVIVYRFKLKNTSNVDVREIGVLLKETNPPHYQNRPPLHFMDDAANNLGAKAEAFIDVIQIVRVENKFHFYTVNPNWNEHYDLADHELSILVNGHNSEPTEWKFRFVYDAPNTEHPIRIEELANDEING